MIHYMGRLSPNGQGTIACGEGKGAASYDLAAADCADCRASLVGMVVVHAEPGSVPATIAEAGEHYVALSWFGTDRIEMPWRQLDIPNPWSRAEQ